MFIKEIPFEEGSLETMTERLFKTMNGMEAQWSERVVPASQKQIHALEEAYRLKQRGATIPYAYLLFLETMGQNDNGLLEQEWDGDTEVKIDKVLEDYFLYNEMFDMDRNAYMLFSTHWSESVLFIKLNEGENPPVYDFDGGLFSGSFEKYLFQMAFRRLQRTQFLYQRELSASPRDFCESLKKVAQRIPCATQMKSRMELIAHLLEPYRLQTPWFCDELHFYGISSAYVLRVSLTQGINIIISSDDDSTLQKMERSLRRLLEI